MRAPTAGRLDGRKLDGLLTNAAGRGLLAKGYEHSASSSAPPLQLQLTRARAQVTRPWARSPREGDPAISCARSSDPATRSPSTWSWRAPHAGQDAERMLARPAAPATRRGHTATLIGQGEKTFPGSG
jgi:hypothetical protein